MDTRAYVERQPLKAIVLTIIHAILIPVLLIAFALEMVGFLLAWPAWQLDRWTHGNKKPHPFDECGE